MIYFPTDIKSIVERVHAVDANAYAKTRNFLAGAVTYLSPYISRGVISLPFIQKIILEKYSKFASEKLIQELAWREYYQRVWQHKGNAIFTDLKQAQQQVLHHQLPTAIINAATGIEGIDAAIHHLYKTGYMHNHARMYTAMLSCNIGQSHFLQPARWMYYHLLDGDLASNMLSWQWVAGSFSSKKYYANQENINKYTSTAQNGTYLDQSYETIAAQSLPTALSNTTSFTLTTTLPSTALPQIKNHMPTYIYNGYNIDPEWHKGEAGNRILLLEPSVYNAHPVSQKVLNFMVQLATNNIPEIQVVVAEFEALFPASNAYKPVFKEHPLFNHYHGIKEERDWLFPQVSTYSPSFFNYWKKCESYR
ncbi:MAG: deoxyribodipyrimidine photolyase [Sphingobacteriia bacterium]|nr:MAG: deoxyribodipyrimidine photolyase [Sphingobacteriia bacterium]